MRLAPSESIIMATGFAYCNCQEEKRERIQEELDRIVPGGYFVIA